MLELNDIPLFSGLDEKQLSEIRSHMNVHQYSKESIVFYEGDKSEYLHVLLEGSVKMYKTTPKGRRIHMHDFYAPEIIALFVAFEHIPFPASCEITSDGYIGLLPLKKLYKCMEDVEFSLAIIKSLTSRMNLLATLVHKETIYTSEAKVADVILNNARVFERLKNTEIAAMLNLTPETLSRILSKLKKEEIIIIKDHVVCILNEDALRDVIETNSITSTLCGGAC